MLSSKMSPIMSSQCGLIHRVPQAVTPPAQFSTVPVQIKIPSPLVQTEKCMRV